MNKTLGKGLALVLGMGIMAGCEYRESTAKPTPKAPETIEIAAGECKDVCGGKICYEVLGTYAGTDSPSRYAISHEGFGDYSVVGRNMIFADECILLRTKATSERLTLKKLR